MLYANVLIINCKFVELCTNLCRSSSSPQKKLKMQSNLSHVSLPAVDAEDDEERLLHLPNVMSKAHLSQEAMVSQGASTRGV